MGRGLGAGEGPRLWGRHVVDSLAAVPLLDHGSRVADVGSGVGLPGIPIAIARPDLSVYLVEARSERVRWMRDVLDRLSVTNAAVVASRWARAPRLRYDVVVCRALAPPERVVRVLHEGPRVARMILYSTVGVAHERGVVRSVLDSDRVLVDIVGVVSHGGGP